VIDTNNIETLTIELLTIKQYIARIVTKDGVVLTSDIEEEDSAEIAHAKLNKSIYAFMINNHSKSFNKIDTKNYPSSGIKRYTKLLLDKIEPRYVHSKFEEIDNYLNNKT
jgi:hypothetical protein